MEILTRGKLAKLVHVNPETVRFYEQQGILPHAPRTQNGYRAYSESAVERIQFIARAKSLGFTLHEIRDLLKLQDVSGSACLNVKMLLTKKLASVRTKKQELEMLESQIAGALNRCNRSLRQSTEQEPACPVFCCLRGISTPDRTQIP